MSSPAPGELETEPHSLAELAPDARSAETGIADVCSSDARSRLVCRTVDAQSSAPQSCGKEAKGFRSEGEVTVTSRLLVAVPLNLSGHLHIERWVGDGIRKYRLD